MASAKRSRMAIRFWRRTEGSWVESLWSVRVVTVLFYALFHHSWIACFLMFLPAPGSPPWRAIWHSPAPPLGSVRNAVCAVHASFAVLVAAEKAGRTLGE